MIQGLRLTESTLPGTPSPPPAPELLVRLEPWSKVFLGNLRDLVWPKREAGVSLSSQPAPFWGDVFVVSRLPWGRFVESAIFHTAAVMVLWSSAQLWPRRPQIVPAAVFHSSDVVYYETTEYLPPLDTGGRAAGLAEKADPVYAPQPIISVPSGADNRRQTIVTPPKVKLNSDVPLPNIVEWKRTAPAVPLTATVGQASNLKAPVLPIPVVAPAPEVTKNRLDPAPALMEAVVAPAPEVSEAVSRRSVRMAQPAIIEPPPKVESASLRKLSDINVGRTQVVAPAPQLPVDEQHALASLSRSPVGGPGAGVVPPPPSVQGTGVANIGGRIIALNVHPAPPPMSVAPPPGNRRGTFATTPDGRAGAAGTPDPPASGKTSANDKGVASKGRADGLPAGLFVGAAPKAATTSTAGARATSTSTGDPPLVASAAAPRISPVPRRAAAEMPADLMSDAEQKVFGPRRFYAMTLSVPNLNSAGGSWVMHFAEIEGGDKPGQLLAPVVTHAVDPGYPLELMRQNVQGTVTLSMVIQSDGRVGNVKVLNGVDDRLDQYASKALLRWQFLPALKDGNPVPLQAVVMIPFRLKRAGF